MKTTSTATTLRTVKYIIALAIIFTLALGLISAHAANDITIKYDDYINVKGKTVEIIDAGTPTSYQVGYKIAANTLDKAVITLKGDNLIATGIGTAKVKIDGVEQTITVEPAKISMLLLAGQSNMRGSEGDAPKSIVCPNGQVYLTYGVPEGLTASNAPKYVASTLAGETRNISINGNKTILNANPIYALTDIGAGKLGPDSGFGYEWNLLTGEKVWVVNAAHGGADIESWQPDGDNYKEAIALYTECMKVLQQEIAAGHYTFSHMGYFWCQGEAGVNAKMSAEWYVEMFLTMHESLKKDVLFDIDADASTPDVTLEFAGIIPVRKGSEGASCYRMGTYPAEYVAASKNINHFEGFEDLRMSGPRVAQFWMGNNPEMKDIWNVCTIQEEWVTFPDGSNGVESYFQAHYPNGRVDYETQSAVSETWRTPKTPAAVHDTIHYNQIGYNELGRESARNALYYLGMVTPPETEVKVEFVCWDGFTPVTSMTPVTSAQSKTLVVPIVSPVYKSKDVTYKIDGDFTYDYYDLVAESYASFGGIIPVGADGTPVTIEKNPTVEYTWELDAENKLVSTGANKNNTTKAAGSIEGGLFSHIQYRLTKNIYLYKDENWALEWTMSGKWYADGDTATQVLFGETLNTNENNNFGIMINGKAQSISVGTYNSMETAQYGICLADHGIDMSASHTYKLINRFEADGTNMLYLFVDGKEIGPMNNVLNADGTDSGKDDNWAASKNFCFASVGAPKYQLCYGIVNKINVIGHVHDYKAEVTAPTCVAKGYTTYTCACGDTYTENETEIVNHTYDGDKDADCNVCGATREVGSNDNKNDDKKGGCGSAKSSGLALVSLLLCAQVGVFFKKRRF